ncbi:MAG TPA: putative cobaltochelatase [Propionibacteriaceae bacterium]|nr:putative cobaltochelatase [Propionibacteriaceae bacterium]
MRTFPFSAVVGSDDMALALILTTVSPQVGGVLVRGEKGTAKSTMVRALASLLPEQQVVQGCRFSCDPADPDPGCPDGPHLTPVGVSRPARLVELPVGATEDRVIGSLDLQKALGSGQTVYEPGLLAAAHRGILYVDEVNLLHDHLVDLLLDAAAMGRSSVEREGVSIAHAARMVLVGTMNPEEGELRPQLLDRFGLTVEIAAPRDPAMRAEVVRRRIAFDSDPVAFVARFQAAEDELQQRILGAQDRLASVRLIDDSLTTIAEVCAAFEVDGMRADIVTARAAVAHAAWHGRDQVTRADIRAAARLALPHRRRRNPFDAPGLDEDLLDRLLGPDEPEPEPTRHDDPDGGAPDAEPGTALSTENQSGPEGTEDNALRCDPPREQRSTAEAPDVGPGGSAGAGSRAAPTLVAQAGAPYRTKLFTARGVGYGEAGHRSRAYTAVGRSIGATQNRRSANRVHLVATLRAAAPRQLSRGRRSGRLRLHPDDFRRTMTEGRESNLVLLCVDASGSMAARRRMEAVKTAVLSLLLDAYQRRDKVGLITFRQSSAVLTLPPTSSVDTAARRMAELASGGRTPLAEGLLCAAETLRLEKLRDPARRPLLMVVTDGRATAGAGALSRAHQAAEHLRKAAVSIVVIDCETGRLSLGLARDLSTRLDAQYLPVSEVGSEVIMGAVHGQRPPGTGRAA